MTSLHLNPALAHSQKIGKPNNISHHTPCMLSTTYANQLLMSISLLGVVVGDPLQTNFTFPLKKAQ
jgi:hypothetical protein